MCHSGTDKKGRSEFRAPNFDIVPAASGEDSYGLRCFLRGFGRFLPQPPYFSGGLTKRLHFWAGPPIGLLDMKNIELAEQKGKKEPYIPGLKPEALRPEW